MLGKCDLNFFPSLKYTFFFFFFDSNFTYMARSTLNISGSEMDNQNRVVQNVHI